MMEISPVEKGAGPLEEEETSSPFPFILHQALTDADRKGFHHIISWSPCGNMFKVHDREGFTKKILPVYFSRQNQYRSFTRQLNSYNFRNLTKEGFEYNGTYLHPLFKRGDASLCHYVVLHKKAKKATGHPASADERKKKIADCSEVCITSAPSLTNNGHLSDSYQQVSTGQRQMSSEGKNVENNRIFAAFLNSSHITSIPPRINNRRESHSPQMPTNRQVQMKKSDQQIDFFPTQSAQHHTVQPSFESILFHAVHLHPSFDPSDYRTRQGGNDPILSSRNESSHQPRLALSDVWGSDTDPLDDRLPNEDTLLITATTEELVDKVAGIIAPLSYELLSDITDEIINTFSQNDIRK